MDVLCQFYIYIQFIIHHHIIWTSTRYYFDSEDVHKLVDLDDEEEDVEHSLFIIISIIWSNTNTQQSTLTLTRSNP